MKAKFLLGSLFVLLFTALAMAGDYANGTVEDGYTYRDGYWWYYQNPYTRERVVTPGSVYYANGCRYTSAPSYSYSYTLYTGKIAPAYTPPAVPSYTEPGWRGKLLDIASQRDKGELALRQLSAEHSAYLESLNALGLSGNFRINGYGQSLGYPQSSYGGANLGSYGVNGNTLYGYSYQSIKDAYGETNMNTLYQQAARNTQTAQQLGGQAHTEFSALVAAAGNNQARVAEILAKAAAVERAFNAANPQPRTTTTTSGSGTIIKPNPPNDPMPPADDQQAIQDGISFLKNTGVPLCGTCHSGANAKGKFDIASYPNLTQAQKAVVWERLTTTDDNLVMPRTADGRPARLSGAQKREFFTH